MYPRHLPVKSIASRRSNTPLYIPGGSLFALWDDPASMLLSDYMRAGSTGTGPSLSFYGDSSCRSIIVECTTAGTADTAILKISLDGGANYTTGITSNFTFSFAGLIFTWADNTTTISLGRVYYSTIGYWNDQTGNGYNHVSGGAATLGDSPEARLGPGNSVRSIAPSHANGANTYALLSRMLINTNVRGQLLTLNQAMSFYIVFKSGTAAAPLYGLGINTTNTPLIVRMDTTNRISVLKSNVVGTSTSTAQTPTNSITQNAWMFFGFSYAGGTNMTYYMGMSGSPTSAAWQSTSGAFATSAPLSDGVFGQAGSNAGAPIQVAACGLGTAAWSAGDFSALKDSVNQRWGGAVV